jgi:hypothetical protein
MRIVTIKKMCLTNGFVDMGYLFFCGMKLSICLLTLGLPQKMAVTREFKVMAAAVPVTLCASVL